MSAVPQSAPPVEEEPNGSATRPEPSPMPPSMWGFLIALSAVAGLAELAFIIVNVSALPVYMKEGLQLPNLPGIALAMFYMAEALGNSPMGMLADRVGRRRMMVFGALISVCTSLVTALIRVPLDGGLLAWLAIGALLLMRILDGVGAAMLWPAVFATVGDKVPTDRQAQAMSALNITYLIGIAFGPFVGGYVNDHFGALHPANDPRRYIPSFYVAAGCFFVTAIIAYIVAPRGAGHHATARETAPEIAALTTGAEAAKEAENSPIAAIKKAMRVCPMLMGLGFIIFLGVGLIAPYVKTFFMFRFGLSESAFGTLILYPALIIGAISLPLGRLSDAWGKTNSIHAGLGICAAALWIILFLTQEWAVVLVGSLLGVGFILSFPAYMAYLAELSGPKERGGMIGAVRMAQGIGALTGSALSSPLYTADSKHLTPFITAGVLLTVGFLLSLFFVRPVSPKATPKATS
jgi:MFS transporter, DHA1 family, multidrug resistance protein